MKKLFVIAVASMLVGSGIAFANEGGKDKKGDKAKTECTKKCTKPCAQKPCCDKSKCKKS